MLVLVCWVVFFSRTEHVPLCQLCHPSVNPIASEMNKSVMFLDSADVSESKSLGRN